MKTDFLGNINSSGKLLLLHQEDFKKWIEGHKGKSVILTIKEYKKKRTNPQNAYYHKIVVNMIRDGMNAFGNDFTTEQAHEFLKKEFNYKEVETKDGYCIKVPGSTTELNTTEFMDFITKVQQFASEVLGIYIPDPSEQLEAPF